MKNQNQNEQELLQKHSPLVSALVNRFVECTPQSLSADHLQSLGLIALLDATRNYSPACRMPFEAFASIEVHGALLTEIRRAKKWFSASPQSTTLSHRFA